MALHAWDVLCMYLKQSLLILKLTLKLKQNRETVRTICYVEIIFTISYDKNDNQNYFF